MEEKEKKISYNETTDSDKRLIREYNKWKHSDAPHLYRMNMLESIYKTLKIAGLEHLV